MPCCLRLIFLFDISIPSCLLFKKKRVVFSKGPSLVTHFLMAVEDLSSAGRQASLTLPTPMVVMKTQKVLTKQAEKIAKHADKHENFLNKVTYCLGVLSFGLFCYLLGSNGFITASRNGITTYWIFVTMLMQYLYPCFCFSPTTRGCSWSAFPSLRDL